MSYSVFPFLSVTDTIQKCPKSEHYGNGYDAQESDRIKYLNEYLNKIGAQTVIIEHEYVDRNFIDDFCGYYARSFRDYPKKCVRLLFFSSKFCKEEIEVRIFEDRKDYKQWLSESFLGYIILRPIPGAHLGKVCLATYPKEEGKNRHFPLCKLYHVHFMGMTFTVCSVAFQEQDNIISACATSALWSAFHCVRDKNPDDVPSPYKITDIARHVFVESTPSNVIDKGLMPPQMAAVISDTGLNPLMSGYISKSMLKALVRAYMNVGVPIILGLTLAYEDEDRADKKPSSHVIGNHAVTLTGYRIVDNVVPPAFSNDNPLTSAQGKKEVELHLVSSNIDKFYAHDDQIGPFTSMEDRSEYWERLETRWNYYTDPEDKVDASINIILIPCFEKIRIRFPLIINFIKRCNVVFSKAWKFFEKTLIWDARIFRVTDFKKSIANKTIFPQLDNSLRLKLLSKNLPRYIWVVESFLDDGTSIATYLFDATDMDSSDYLICALHHDPDSFNIYHHILNSWQQQEFDSYIFRLKRNRAVLRSLLSAYRKGNGETILLP